MATKKDEVHEVNSYLFEVFKLNPEYSDIYCQVTEDKDPKDINMNDFICRHYPKAPIMKNLESSLSPYIKAQQFLAISKLRYTEALKRTSQSEEHDNLNPEEQSNLKRAKEEIPRLISELKSAEQSFNQQYELMREKLAEIIKEVGGIENSLYEKRREFVYKMLDNLGIPRSQYKDKRIDNPLKFKSFYEAYDYMERQTQINKTKIPIKKWQDAEHDYAIFEQLIIYLGLVDCLLPLGIDYAA